MELIKKSNYFIPDLEKIKPPPSLLEAFNIERLPRIPMLFKTRYLITKDYYRKHLYISYPNQEVKKAFTENLIMPGF
ncbi:MAG: hypothetical protein H6680_03760 [Desulfobacteraceae bacterium]|nr:hypothetical protein [Desulfobacteraceae bacterium]